MGLQNKDIGLVGRVAIVTGASRGIGPGIARALAARGANIVMVARTPDQLAREAERVRQLGVEALEITADVSDLQEIQMMVDRAVQQFGRLDILVNNAGILRMRRFLDHDLEAWDDTFAVNTRGVFLCSQAAARVMVAAGRGGRIIMNTSYLAREALKGFTSYCASKAAVESMTLNLALELAPYQITVNAFQVAYVPSTIVTEERSQAERAEIEREMQEQGILRRLGPPLGRMGTPEDVGAAVAFLASDEAAWITGASLHVDGGTHLRKQEW